MKNPKSLVFLILVGIVLFSCQSPLMQTGGTGSIEISITIPDGLKSSVPEAVRRAIADSDLGSRFIHPGTTRIEAQLYSDGQILNKVTTGVSVIQGNERTASIKFNRVPLQKELELKISLYDEEGMPLGSYDGKIGPFASRKTTPVSVAIRPIPDEIGFQFGEPILISDDKSLYIIKMELDLEPEEEGYDYRGIYRISGAPSNNHPLPPIEIYMADGRKHRGFNSDPEDFAFGYFGIIEEGEYYLVVYNHEKQNLLIELAKSEMKYLLGGKRYYFGEEISLFDNTYLYDEDADIGALLDIEGSSRSMEFQLYNPYPVVFRITGLSYGHHYDYDIISDLEKMRAYYTEPVSSNLVLPVEPGRSLRFDFGLSARISAQNSYTPPTDEPFRIGAVLSIVSTNLHPEHNIVDILPITGYIVPAGGEHFEALTLGYYISSGYELDDPAAVFKIYGEEPDEDLPPGIYYISDEGPSFYNEDFRIEILDSNGNHLSSFSYGPDNIKSGFFEITEPGDYYLFTRYIGSSYESSLFLELNEAEQSFLISYKNEEGDEIFIDPDYGYAFFGNSIVVLPGYEQTRSFTIHNLSSQVLSNISIDIGIDIGGGDSAFSYVEGSLSPSSIQAGGSASFEIVFKPTKIPDEGDENFSSSVGISLNDDEENTYSFTVHGTSLAARGLVESPQIHSYEFYKDSLHFYVLDGIEAYQHLGAISFNLYDFDPEMTLYKNFEEHGSSIKIIENGNDGEITNLFFGIEDSDEDIYYLVIRGFEHNLTEPIQINYDDEFGPLLVTSGDKVMRPGEAFFVGHLGNYQYQPITTTFSIYNLYEDTIVLTPELADFDMAQGDNGIYYDDESPFSFDGTAINIEPNSYSDFIVSYNHMAPYGQDTTSDVRRIELTDNYYLRIRGITNPDN